MTRALRDVIDARPLTSRADVRPLIADAVPWSPLDFIKGISRTGDRRLVAESVARPIDPADDLRIVYPLTPDVELAICVERLPWDSAFFGYEVARLQGVFPLTPGGYTPEADYAPALQAAVRLAAARGIRYLFGVVDARDLPTTRALASLGFTLLETRVYFHRSLRAYEHPRRFQCRLATASDVDSLVELSRAAANPYDRFNADPFIGRDEALRLIARWIRASIVDQWADATVVPDSAQPTALCTVKHHDDRAASWGTSIAQLVLAMATPAGGRLVGVISETNYRLKARGAEHVFFTTQIANRRAIRVAEHLGFTFGRGEHVFRLLL